MVTEVTNHFPLDAVPDKCVFDLSQRLWNVHSHLMDYRIQVSLEPGKQQPAADALGRNPVWPWTVENSVGEVSDSGYEDACFMANEYGEECVFEGKLCVPMIADLIIAAKKGVD